MVQLVLVRHGQSQANLDHIFTGWTDVKLTELGRQQGIAVGKMFADRQLQFTDVHTSYMQRAIITADLILDQIDQLYLPIHKTWRLNERHYGALSGLNKLAVAKQVGQAQVQAWRRGYTAVPPQLAQPRHERRYDRLGITEPTAESLAMTLTRLLPYWQDEIAPRLLAGKNQLIVAHGSSLRALIKYLEQIDDDQIDQVEVPNGRPIIYELDDQLQIKHKEIMEVND
ncbi:2,3-bisphosphoglycerate-dependent phosphoglycerate mutase [Limosilactobacillus equigenerosi]|uniref:2,3-bisphosphoglycerate-dependent phosphoglycerate mutase n=1 Tax=Limosilactobacillus equigenerosi DSM 18793 = JCM 14505 TaxID=1423742 RepID=A0A0R1UGU6_9LACO|nr:2,3-bisphosphoglycerate-dependent phosphoglycerate mutase [Limosilactobacillus equigenerosi]KRL92625.1 2,3-bisphosphoglycerate-dependent phosphoglycerate mutase [Limosilactobacillus equigenerosi DSM 18793 = JCM 14505]